MSGVLGQGFPNRVSSFLNPDGTLKDVWYRFFRSLWVRTGGATAPGTIDELTAFVLMGDAAEPTPPDQGGLLGFMMSDGSEPQPEDFAYLLGLAVTDEPPAPESDPVLSALIVSDV